MIKNALKQTINFYIDGFKNMKLGKTLWLVILVKLFIMFFILKILIFNERLNTKFDNDNAISDYVIENLTREIK